MRARRVELDQAALRGGARVGELLGHQREGARQAAELVARREHLRRAQVAAPDLAHALGQQQQRPRELVAEHHREQHRAEHREDQRQRQRADVHALEALAGERALLVLAVGALHREGLKRMYIGTLTLALFLAVFGAVLLAVVLGNQLARPLLLLAEGVRQVCLLYTSDAADDM